LLFSLALKQEDWVSIWQQLTQLSFTILTGRDYALHTNECRNPQADLQAQARAHRLGQTKPVKVYRLLCEGTVEERVMDISDRKLVLSSVVIKDNDDQAELKGFSANELLNLIKFGAGTIFSSKGKDLTEADVDAIIAK
jgi:hypothetical protein